MNNNMEKENEENSSKIEKVCHSDEKANSSTF
jgi:hypothetical protein